MSDKHYNNPSSVLIFAKYPKPSSFRKVSHALAIGYVTYVAQVILLLATETEFWWSYGSIEHIILWI